MCWNAAVRTAEAHHGQVSAENQSSGGALFTIRLKAISIDAGGGDTDRWPVERLLGGGLLGVLRQTDGDQREFILPRHALFERIGKPVKDGNITRVKLRYLSSDLATCGCARCTRSCLAVLFVRVIAHQGLRRQARADDFGTNTSASGPPKLRPSNSTWPAADQLRRD